MPKTINVMVAGAAGRMGKLITKQVLENPQMRLVGVFEHPDHSAVGSSVGVEGQVPLTIKGSFKEAIPEAAIWTPDVVIDFTTPESTLDLILAVAEHNNSMQSNLAMVIGTTGLTEETLTILKRLKSVIPCVQSPNMAVGVNLLFKLVEKTALVLGDAYDVEIVEAHHRMKKDAPSGTALKLGEMAATALGRDFGEVGVLERNGVIGERTDQEIGVQTIRAGDIVGEHTVYFAGAGERIELTHRAHSRDNFVRGAILAANWISYINEGFYTMSDVLGLDDLL